MGRGEGVGCCDQYEGRKAAYAIPDSEDSYWEVDDHTTSGGVEKAYSLGFAADDELGTVVNSMVAQDRDAYMQYLKDGGYPMANLPFEKAGDAAHPRRELWLVNAAQFFDQTIGRNLTGEAFSSAVYSLYGPIDIGLWDPGCELVVWICNRWVCQHRNCTPQTVYGEWVASGHYAGCTTHDRGPGRQCVPVFAADICGGAAW